MKDQSLHCMREKIVCPWLTIERRAVKDQSSLCAGKKSCAYSLLLSEESRILCKGWSEFPLNTQTVAVY